MNLLSYLWRRKWILRNIFASIYFNFRCLPFKKAIYLPILLYKPTFIDLSGKIIIQGPIRFGMIKLGIFQVSIFPNTGIILENRGLIKFEGKTEIGNASALSVGETGTLSFGADFRATCGLKIACYHQIYFDSNVLVGWNCQVMDTDFHMLTNVNGGGYQRVWTDIYWNKYMAC